jgi:hypothetical protein
VVSIGILIPDFSRKIFSFCLLNIVPAVGVSYILFIILSCFSSIPSFFVHLVALAVLGFESSLQRPSVTWAMLPAHFTLVIFETWFRFCLDNLDIDPICASCSSWEDTHTTMPRFFCWYGGLTNFPPKLALNCDCSSLCLLSI